MSTKLSDQAVRALCEAVITGNTVSIPGQLARPLYLEVNNVLELLGGKWNRGAKGHVFDYEPHERIADVIDAGEITDTRKVLGYFPTPSALADRIVEIAQPEPGQSILEPSAGKGSIVRAIQRRVADCVIRAVEFDEQHAEDLAECLPEVGACQFGDFLQMDPTPAFDRVIANPPFGNGKDCEHVRRMYDWLKPGGRLVAIMAASVTFRTNGKFSEFKDWLRSIGNHVIEELPAESFKESGTGVNTVVITINKAA